jgi:hypothetical protein
MGKCEQRMQIRGSITEALTTLLEAGEANVNLLTNIVPLDVMILLGGTAVIACAPEQQQRAAQLLMDELRCPSDFG